MRHWCIVYSTMINNWLYSFAVYNWWLHLVYGIAVWHAYNESRIVHYMEIVSQYMWERMRCLLIGNYTTYALYTIVCKIGVLSTRIAEQLLLHKHYYEHYKTVCMHICSCATQTELCHQLISCEDNYLPLSWKTNGVLSTIFSK